MRRFISARPSPAMAVAFIALLAALSGTVAGDARRGFDEMMRVLRPSGRALFSVWAPAGSY